MTPVARAELLLARLLQSVVGAVMLGGVLINFANVVARYLFLRPFVWAEEVMQFLNIWVVMLGAAVITRNGTHLKMDAVYHLVPARARRALDALTSLLVLAVSVYVIYQALQMIQMLAATGQRSVIARFPMNVVYAAIPVGFGCGILFLLLWLWGYFRKASAPEARREAAVTLPDRAP